ncbi:hypothetical protein V8F20_009208 [Naviculisporaceae sp. PSN 640]
MAEANMPVNGTAGPPSNSTGPPPEAFAFPTFIIITQKAATLAQVYLGLTSVFLVFCVIAFGTRMYQRTRPVWHVGLDDYFIIVGFILAIVDWGLLTPQMVTKAGIMSMEQSMNAGKHSWIAIGIWGMSMTFIKVSIALTLLRIQQKSLAWRIFLYSIMAIQSLYGILNLFFNLVIACRPLHAAWDFGYQMMHPGSCVSFEIQRTVSNIGSSINITTDILLSLSPAIFLFKLNRPLRERLFVCGLMAMGLFASGASIVKTVIVQGYGDLTLPPEEFYALGISISLWTSMEQLLGLLAACVPAMKGLFQFCLGKVGVSLTTSRNPARSGYYMNSSSRPGIGGSHVGTGTFQTITSRNMDRDGDDVDGMKSRFEMRHLSVSKADMESLEEDEEVLDTTGARRNISTPKSGRTDDSQGSFHHGTSTELRGFPAAQLPAHAV